MRVSLVFGTRPEAIKLCPLVRALKSHSSLSPHVCVTGQHREMLDQVLRFFGIQPDEDLNLMRENQTLAALTSRAVSAVDSYLEQAQPDVVIVQGDTTTVLSAALAAFYRQIPVGHVEAGLRTWDMKSPFPEEMNRVVASRLARWHFAPTTGARDNLVREGVSPDLIHVTGNTVIDALMFAVEKVRKERPVVPGVPESIMESAERMVVITGHRRENFGQGFRSICAAIAELADMFPDTRFVYPVHLNPNVRTVVHESLGGSRFKNIDLIEPLDYPAFVRLMDRATMLLTDSGGVQEEAPSLGKPVLVMRDTTERPEAVEMGTVRLVGTDRKAIVENVAALLTDETALAAMANAVNPYGDGLASGRIVAEIERFRNADEEHA